MASRTRHAISLGACMLVALPSIAQRRGEAMKATAADDRKALVTPTDEGFVRNASGAYQVGSKLAMFTAVRATNPALKALGTRLVQEFIALGTELKPGASGEKGYQWSHEPSPDDQKMLDALDRLDGRDLDNALGTQIVALLERIKAVFSAEAEKGRDPDLKPVAQQSVPWVEKRLREARALGAGAH